jgi:F-type H+-transporting ATPase subunit c
MKNRILAALSTFVGTMLVALPAFAQEAEHGVGQPGLIAIGAGIAIGVAAAGGSVGQGRAAAAALEGIARNPQASERLFTPMIIGLALIESLVIYALVIALFLQAKF